MASAGSRGAAAALPRPRNRAASAKLSDVGTAAWLCALPCAAITIAIVVLLGPPLSRVLYAEPLPVLPTVEHRPEPIEETRFLLALLGPILLVVSIALVSLRLQLPRRPAVALAGLAQVVGVTVVVACFVKQREPVWELAFFTAAQLAGAAAGALALALAARRGWLTRWRPEPRTVRVAAAAVALVAAAIWFLWLLNTGNSIYWYGSAYNTGFMVDETFAVLNGFTPLVDYTAAYGSLWPFLLAPVLALFGKTMLVWTALMWALTVAMLLAAYGVLRRVTHTALGALALYLPFMGVVFLAAWRSPPPIAIYQQVPLRNFGPFLLAWLVARHLDRGRGATWPVAFAAGLVALNNPDFGLAALAATFAALVWARFPLSRHDTKRLASSLAIGLASALALVSAVTLVRARALPNLLHVVEIARLYRSAGIASSPLPHVLGLPLVVYLTYTAALGTAAVRTMRREPDRTLTGMLAWSGVFGFGAAAYYVNASLPLGVPTLFPAWGLAVALLAVAAVRQIASQPARRPRVPALAALFGISLLATTLADPLPQAAPWSQVHRLTTPVVAPSNTDAEPVEAPQDRNFRWFVSSIPDGRGNFVLRRGAAVAFLTATGHVIADAYGLKDVVPFTGESVFTTRQFDEAVGRLRAAGGSTVLVPTSILPRVSALLVRQRFGVVTTAGPRIGVPGRSVPWRDVVTFVSTTVSPLTKWVSMRSFAPASE